MFGIITEIISTAVSFVSKAVSILGPALVEVANLLVGNLKPLGISENEEDAIKLGDKAIQAEESGIRAEDFDSYEKYLLTVDQFETNPEKSLKIEDEEKIQKGMEISTAVLVERYGESVIDLLTLVANHPDFFKDRLSIYSEMQKKDPETFSDIARYIDGKETDLKKADETLEKIFDAEKRVDPDKTLTDLLKSIENLKD